MGGNITLEEATLLDCVLRNGQGRQGDVFECAHGPSIPPLDGESVNSCTLHSILSITAELPSTAWPYRLRHVEGQTFPKLQFQAKPFLIALKVRCAHQ